MKDDKTTYKVLAQLGHVTYFSSGVNLA